jgi:hypothetical protein
VDSLVKKEAPSNLPAFSLVLPASSYSLHPFFDVLNKLSLSEFFLASL